MTVLKVGQVKQVFHDAGVNRISRVSIAAIDDAVQRAIKDIADDIVKVYPGRLIEGADLIRLAKVKGGYMLVLKAGAVDELDLEALLKDERLPDDFVPEEEEE